MSGHNDGFLSRAMTLATSRRRHDVHRRRVARRLTAGALAASALVVAVGEVRGAQARERGVATVVAARDLPAGHVVTATDVRVEARAAAGRSSRAVGEVRAVVGLRLNAFVAARDVVGTDRVGAPVAGLPAGHLLVAVPVTSGALVSPGREIDLFAPGSGARVAAGVRVHSSTGCGAGGSASGAERGLGGDAIGATGDGSRGCEVVIAVAQQQAQEVTRALATAAGEQRLVPAARAS